MKLRVVVLAALLVAAIGALFLIRTRGDDQLTPLDAGADGHLDIRYADHSDRNLIDVYTPAGAGPHPTIIWLHPGGWVQGDKAASMPIWDWTERGYAVVAVNYRYAADPDTVAESTADAIDATRFIVEHHADWNLDLERIGVYGFSAGGHLAAMIATTELPISALAIAGAPTDFGPMLDLTDPFFDGRSGPAVAEVARMLLGCEDPAGCAAAATAVSPAQLEPGAAPVLVVHGENDSLVYVDNARRYAAHLESHEVDVRLVIVAGGVHAPHVDLGGIDVFFDEHLLSR